MSVLIEQQRVAVSEPVREEQDMLVFAAASIVREMSSYSGDTPVREVVSEDRRYRLEGRRLHPMVDGTPVVLVFVEAVAAPLPNDEELRRRFGLTRKEAGVARLIAEDQTNEQIARRLSISPHTARHHTERILAKLGAKSRTLVRNALVQGTGQ
jgi:DNA-binding CsgD family transcriptional regulator